ncbi:MAG: response regulator [Caldilineae bacterium]|nr:MAG: response regulator [Caldilineae bacterium]
MMKAGKILIIDDEPLTCELIGRVLKLQGYPSAAVTDSKRALEVALAERPALILLDYHLGAGHGLEVLQTLRANASTRAIPVILTSGLDRHQEAADAGADAFLLKPFDWQELTHIVKQVLSTHPATHSEDA